jgi:hypothetical protein
MSVVSFGDFKNKKQKEKERKEEIKQEEKAVQEDAQKESELMGFLQDNIKIVGPEFIVSHSQILQTRITTFNYAKWKILGGKLNKIDIEQAKLIELMHKRHLTEDEINHFHELAKASRVLANKLGAPN